MGSTLETGKARVKMLCLCSRPRLSSAADRWRVGRARWTEASGSWSRTQVAALRARPVERAGGNGDLAGGRTLRAEPAAARTVSRDLQPRARMRRGVRAVDAAVDRDPGAPDQKIRSMRTRLSRRRLALLRVSAVRRTMPGSSCGSATRTWTERRPPSHRRVSVM